MFRMITHWNVAILCVAIAFLSIGKTESMSQTNSRKKVEAKPSTQTAPQTSTQPKTQTTPKTTAPPSTQTVPPANTQPKLSDQEQKDAVERLLRRPLNGFFGFTFTNAVPQKEFFDNIKRSGQGFSVYGGWHMDPYPFAAGIEGDILFYGSDERRGLLNWKDPYGVWHTDHDTISTQNMVIPVNVFIRVMPTIARTISPYVEGIVGVTFMSLSVDYKSSYSYAGSNYNDKQSKSDIAFNYGVGAGIMIKLVDFIQIPNSISNLNLDIRMRYLYGGEAEYYKAKFDDTKNPPQLNLNGFKSNTDLVLFMAGITFRF